MPSPVCTYPLVPKTCGCNATCSEPDKTCEEEQCEPGCYCEDGLVMEGGKCIKRDNCPCLVDGIR